MIGLLLQSLLERLTFQRIGSLEDDKTALLGVKVKIANDTGDYIVQIKDLLKSSHFMVAKDKLTD